ncbi:MAG TPA: hypothetical protein VJN02_03135 [Gammaproteobacteria bacterium]|nr:hypothetical protein [Gammaproteobacteria bacterium]
MDTNDVLDFVAEVDRDTRVIRDFKPGMSVRQGDIYIDMLSGDFKNLARDRKELEKRIKQGKFWKEFKFGALGERTTNLQLVNGTSLGSRHSISDADRSIVEVYAPTNTNPLEGPVLVAKSRFTIVHPEHAWVELPAGTYQIRYQRDFAQEELARIMD